MGSGVSVLKGEARRGHEVRRNSVVFYLECVDGIDPFVPTLPFGG